jgi:hypothetical protein
LRDSYLLGIWGELNGPDEIALLLFLRWFRLELILASATLIEDMDDLQSTSNYPVSSSHRKLLAVRCPTHRSDLLHPVDRWDEIR